MTISGAGQEGMDREAVDEREGVDREGMDEREGVDGREGMDLSAPARGLAAMACTMGALAAARLAGRCMVAAMVEPGRKATMARNTKERTAKTV